MKFHSTPLEGVTVVELEPRNDERGSFARAFCLREMSAAGLAMQVAQVNLSCSTRRGTLRGMHFQLPPFAEAKLVRCVRGSVYDLCLDVRADSPTFGQSWGVDLTDGNRLAVYLPKGIAHGYLTLSDNCEVLYLTDEFYSSQWERGIRWNDPRFELIWPFEPLVISERDSSHPDYEVT